MSGQRPVYRLSLRDRTDSDQLSLLSLTQVVSIDGSAGDDSLWIDFLAVATLDAGGNFEDYIPASIQAMGLGGVDGVRFTGPTADAGDTIVDAETILVGVENQNKKLSKCSAALAAPSR